MRRSIHEPDESTAFIVFAPEGTSLAQLAWVAGQRWHVEIGFEKAKGEVGLDHYEVRSWHGWYRYITLALVAHAVLDAIWIGGQDMDATKKGAPLPSTNSLAAFKCGRGLS